jgi:hypothetical protein
MAARRVSAAVPLIELDASTGQYAVAEAGAEYLSRLSGRLAVVVVCGRYRTGKSFLLNHLSRGLPDGDGTSSAAAPPAGAGVAHSFGVGHTVESFTKGIWLCGEPLRVTGADGGVVNVVFMDSEGLGATDKVSVTPAPGCTARQPVNTLPAE